LGLWRDASGPGVLGVPVPNARLYLSPQRRLVNSQFSRGLGPVPPVATEGLVQEPRLEAAEGRDALHRGSRLRWAEGSGQVFNGDLAAPAEDEGVLDDVFEFADIPGEVVRHEKLERLGREARDVFPLETVQARDKVIDQQRDVLASLA